MLKLDRKSRRGVQISARLVGEDTDARGEGGGLDNTR
jgi:hypothetical protein